MTVFNNDKEFAVTETIGGFGYGNKINGFDDIYTEAYHTMLESATDVMLDINDLVKNKAKMATFKDSLLSHLKTECEEMQESGEDYGTHAYLYDQVSTMFDNCVEDLVKEATTVNALLPIKTLDFPILIKQALRLASNDIMQTEVTKTPVIKKHIQQTYVVDRKTNRRWRYPQCFFSDEFEEIYKAGKGLEIDSTVKVPLNVYNYDIISNLTPGDVNKDEFTMDLKIEKVYVTDPDLGTEVEVVLSNPMRINLSDGMWLGGKIKKTITRTDGTTFEIDDLVTGSADIKQKTVSLASFSGDVTSVSFSGFLSNERNERTVGFEYEREEIEWKIEDGMRADSSYSLERLEDTKALLDVDLYKMTYNDISDLLVQEEDSKVLSWLDEQYNKYNGVDVVDVLGWDSFITETIFDCNSTGITTALPNEYINTMLKWKIDGLIVDICDRAKLEDMTFVIYGNPRYIRFLDPIVKWVVRPGSTSNGVKLDYGYGIMTSADVKVQVVSTKKVMHNYDSQGKMFKGLRIIPFPLNDTQFTFKHYKYTTHILTSQNSAYRDSNLSGGSATYLVGTSRYTNAVIQGIQAQVNLVNAEDYILQV